MSNPLFEISRIIKSPQFDGVSANAYNNLVNATTQGNMKIDSFEFKKLSPGEGVVFDENLYFEISSNLEYSSQIFLGEMDKLYSEIEELSQNDFQLSSSYPKIQNIINNLRVELNNFCELNKEASKNLKNYTDNIYNIDQNVNLNDCIDIIKSTDRHTDSNLENEIKSTFIR